jgi:WD40 repeat protein
MTSQIWNLNTERKQRINQTGKWEHEKLAKISFKVFRHLEDDSVITSCQLCNKSPGKSANDKAEMNSSEYFILSTTSNGNVYLTDIENGNNLKKIGHEFQNQRIPEIHRAKYNKFTGNIGFVCMDGTVCEYSADNEKPSFQVKLPGSCQDFDVNVKNNGNSTNSESNSSYNSVTNLIATVCDIDNSLNIFDPRQKAPVIKISNHHEATPTSCAFVGNCGQKIATAGMDGVLKVTDIASRRVLIKIQENGVISSATSDPFEKRTIVTTSWNKTVKLYDIATGLYRHEIKYNNDGLKNVELVNTEICETELENKSDSRIRHNDEINHFEHTGCVSCSAFLNQKHLVTGAYDRHAILWSIEKNNRLSKKVDLRGHEDWVTGIDGSSDANWVLTSSKDATIRLWNLENAVMTVEKPQLV